MGVTNNTAIFLSTHDYVKWGIHLQSYDKLDAKFNLEKY